MCSRRKGCALVAAAGLVLAAIGCVSHPPPARPANVVLIVVDTLRADHLSCYGYERETSPRIDAFARMATRYENSISAAPWTVPSHASLFTGKPPFAHGAHTFAVERPVKNVNPLRAEEVTFAEALREAGYRTGAFVANVAYLSRDWGLDQGFDSYEVERLYADRLNEKIFDWLDARDDAPFFLFVNYIDTHRPYNTTPRPGFIDPPAEQSGNELLDRLSETVMRGTEPPEPTLVRRVIDQYDTSIANVDEQVGRLLDRLDASGLTEQSVIVVTSDHGEYFGEHRLIEHSKDVYQPALAVPLIVRAPGQGEGRVDPTPVVSNDVPALIARELLDPLGAELLQTFRDEPGEHPLLAENYYTRRKDLFHPVWGARFNRVRRAVFDWPLKYIESSDGADELYDLEADPDEHRNLVGERPDDARRLAERVAALADHWPPAGGAPDRSPLSEEQLERLKSLGYVGD